MHTRMDLVMEAIKLQLAILNLYMYKKYNNILATICTRICTFRMYVCMYVCALLSRGGNFVFSIYYILWPPVPKTLKSPYYYRGYDSEKMKNVFHIITGNSSCPKTLDHGCYLRVICKIIIPI